MSDWEIRIPFRSRDDSLTNVAVEARAFDPEERRVARALVHNAVLNTPVWTAGELVDILDTANRVIDPGLLRQPGGFGGFGRVPVGPDTDDPPIPKGPDVGVVGLHFHPAFPARTAHPMVRDTTTSPVPRAHSRSTLKSVQTSANPAHALRRPSYPT